MRRGSSVTVSRIPQGARAFRANDLALLMLLSSFWGLSFLFINVALRHVQPLWIVAARTLVGAATIGALAVLVDIRRHDRAPSARVWLHLLVLATFNNAVPWTAVTYAQRNLPSGTVALLMAVVPTSTLLVAAAVGLERLTPIRLGGLLLALLGVAIIATSEGIGEGRGVGIVAVLVATLLYAASSVYIKRFVSGVIPPLRLATGQVLLAGIIVLPVAWAVEGRPPAVGTIPASALVALLALGALGTGFAYYLFYELIHRVGATNTSMTAYLVPLVGVVAGALVLDERLGWSAAVGGALIATGIWASQQRMPPADLDLDPGVRASL